MAIAHLPATRATPRPLSALLASTVLLASCVSIIQHPLQMTYHSDPEGATLYQGAQRWGYTPVTLVYQAARDTFPRRQCLALLPVQARWASGASATLSGVAARAAQGYNLRVTILRPSSAPGADIDASFSVQLQRNGIMQQQADAQSAIAVEDYLKAPSATKTAPH